MVSISIQAIFFLFPWSKISRGKVRRDGSGNRSTSEHTYDQKEVRWWIWSFTRKRKQLKSSNWSSETGNRDLLPLKNVRETGHLWVSAKMEKRSKGGFWPTGYVQMLIRPVVSAVIYFLNCIKWIICFTFFSQQFYSHAQVSRKGLW